MSIFPSGGVPNNGVFTEPAIPTIGGCNGFYDPNCLVPLDVDALNSGIKEDTNLTDAAGIAWDCGSNMNRANAVRSIACQEIASRVFTGVSSGIGTQSVTLPAGGSWDVQVVALGTEASNGGLFVNGAIIGDQDDDIRLATTVRVIKAIASADCRNRRLSKDAVVWHPSTWKNRHKCPLFMFFKCRRRQTQ